MIVELTSDQLAQLLMGEPVVLGTVTVRKGDGRVLMDAPMAPQALPNRCGSCGTGVDHIAGRCRTCGGPWSPASTRERRAEARSELVGDAQFWMRAKFDGRCPRPAASGCHSPIAAGDRVLRDKANGKTYCAGCGSRLYPNVIDRHAVSA